MYLAGNEDGAGPVAAVLDVRGVGDQVLRRLLGERLAGEARGAAGEAVRETLVRGGDGERSGGEEHLGEEGGSELHDGGQRRRGVGDSSGAVRTR